MQTISQKPIRMLESKAFWVSVLALCVLHAFCTGFYMPSIWTTNYYTINFFDGFFRRALIGTFLYPFGDLRLNYHFIAFVQLLAGAGVLSLLFYKSATVKENCVCAWLVLCAFFLSSWGRFFFAMQGHPEYLMYLLALLSVVVKSNVLRVAMIASTVWIHEMAVFTCLPLWFALEYIHYNRKVTAWVGMIAAAVSFIVIYLLFRTVDGGVLLKYAQWLTAANYVPAYDYLYVFSDEVAQSRFRWESWYMDVGVPFPVDGLCLVLLLVLAVLLFVAARASGKRKKTPFELTVIFVAGLSPLLLGWFGYDLGRWVFMAMANIMVLFFVLQDGFDKRWKVVFVMAALICFLTTDVGRLPDFKYYRDFDEALDFVFHIGQRITSIPLR